MSPDFAMRHPGYGWASSAGECSHFMLSCAPGHAGGEPLR